MEINEISPICLGFTPTILRKLRRKARIVLPEMENNQLPPHIRTINIVIKNLDPTEFPSLSAYLTNMLNDLRTLNLLNNFKISNKIQHDNCHLNVLPHLKILYLNFVNS
jgi:hypothetical protein